MPHFRNVYQLQRLAVYLALQTSSIRCCVIFYISIVVVCIGGAAAAAIAGAVEMVVLDGWCGRAKTYDKSKRALDDKVKYANEICFKRTFVFEVKIVYEIHTNAIQMNLFKFSGKHLTIAPYGVPTFKDSIRGIVSRAVRNHFARPQAEDQVSLSSYRHLSQWWIKTTNLVNRYPKVADDKRTRFPASKLQYEEQLREDPHCHC
uniref:Uncharacterized protein n=1 Tax=Glossina pallidipes TaxID=7398 RepID=A0A1B0A1Z8_GLOPL